MAMDPRCSIRDFPRFHSFKVTMSGLTTWDSGEYWCGFYEHPYVYLLKTVYLEVAKAPTPPTTRHTQRTMMVTAPASATSPAVASPPGDWKWKAIVVAVVVAVLLLLSLSVLTILYLGRARGRGAREGEKTDSLHIYDDLRKENTDFNQPAASDQDAETIHYASLTHLNHSGTKDPIDSDSHMADRLLSVEYASITRQRPQLSMSPVLDGEPRN
ncbi:CMRF35-like molecule 8 isoform X2 [Cavia porcellus]|nr:CMRF35-like molecule 8 isoform X2 [Cavia porcellus]